MKRMIMTLVAVWMMITSMNAQRLTNIQAEARFITDKMVVELGLSSAQRNSILNINLNYLNGIRSYRDIDAYGWHYRNKQLKRMMTARQWKRFKDSYYFYRPIGWQNHVYVHHIYTKYPKHNWGHDKRRPRPECSYGRPGWPGGTHVTYGPGKPCKHHKYHKHDKKWKHDRDWSIAKTHCHTIRKQILRVGGHRFFYDRNLLGQVHTQITVKDSDHIRIIPDNYLTITRTFSPNTGFSIITIISKLFQ